MKIYPSNMNHLRYTKPTAQEIQEQYYFPCSITVLNLTTKIAEVFYYDGDGAECALGKTEIPSDYLIKKSLSKTDAAPTVIGLYPLKETGTYANLGNINAEEGKLNFASFDGFNWSLIEINIETEISEKLKDLYNNNIVGINSSLYSNQGFIYVGDSYPKGSLQSIDSNNLSSGFFYVLKGQKIKTNAALAVDGAAIAFYSTANRSSFISSVNGIDSHSMNLYEAIAPENCYVSFSTSKFSYPNAFEESYYEIDETKIYVSHNNEQYNEVVNNLTGTLLTSNIFNNQGFIYVGDVFPKGSLQSKDSNNGSSNLFFVKKGQKIKTYAALAVDGAAIAFYSTTDRSSFISSVNGIDGHSMNLYETIAPQNCYVSFSTSKYFYTNAFDESYYQIEQKRVYVYEDNIEKNNETNNNDNEKVVSLALFNDYKDYNSYEWFLSSGTRLPHPQNFLSASNAEKKGVVIFKTGVDGDFNGGQVESPSIIWDSILNKYVMTFTAYTTTNVGSIGWAISDDLENWTVKGQLFTASGNSANGDGHGCTGSMLFYYDNYYYLYYLGLNGEGYEGEPINMCLARTKSLTSPSWEYLGIKIPIQTTIAWANEAIYHPYLMFTKGKFYMFFNARGTINGKSKERSGFATSDSPIGDWVVNKDRISEFAEVRNQDSFIPCGDPAIFYENGFYYMVYFAIDGTFGVVDFWAYTTKEDFPFGWIYGGNSTSLGTTYDSVYAHKPFLLKKDNKIYHYYTAVGTNGKVIALQIHNL